jgi:iron complex outermembrane recepter protein
MRFSLAILLVGSLAATAFESEAIASDATVADEGPAAADGSKSGDLVLEQVIVTATRRSESTLKVPLSIEALSTDRLIDSNVKNISDVSREVPGVTFSTGNAVSPSNSNLTIRGIGTGTGDATTGIYIDESAIQGQTSSVGDATPAVFDLDRVEVLRGPQGTLFGSSTMGGAVRFIQAQPNLTSYSARITTELAGTDSGGLTYEVGLAGGGPLVQNLLGFRASVWERRDGGYVDWVNPFTGQTIDSNTNRTMSRAARLALTWAPVDGLKITPSVFVQDKYEHNTADNYHFYVSDPARGDFNNAEPARLPFRDRFTLASLTANADVGFADLIAISSYLKRDAKSIGDSVPALGAIAPFLGFPDGYGNPLGPSFPTADTPPVFVFANVARHSITEELRLSSRQSPERLTWTAGVYYARSVEHDYNGFTGTIPFGLDDAGIVTKNVNVADNTEQQMSVFAQADVRIVGDLKATLGVRYSHFDVHTTTGIAAVLPENDFFTSGVQRNNTFTPKYGLEYQIDPSNMVYVSVAKGFRAGGVNAPVSEVCGTTAPAGYSPDSLWSYELGTKSEFLDQRASLATSFFYVDWSNIQTAVEIAQCQSFYTRNAGAAHVKGFDLAGSWILAPGLQADLSVAYVDAKYASDVSTDIPIVKKGYVVGDFAPWSMTGSLQYTFAQVAGHPFVRIEDIYRTRNDGPRLSQLPGSPSYNPDLPANDGYSELNLRAGGTFGRFELAVFSTNTLNKHPTFNWNDYAQGNTFTTASTLTPRTVGVNLNARF